MLYRTLFSDSQLSERRWAMAPILISLPTLAILEALIILQGAIAYRDGFLWPSQMLERTSKGLPIAMHAGMWSCLCILSPLLASIVAYHEGEWSRFDIMITVALGLTASLMMHDQYTGIPCAEAH